MVGAMRRAVIGLLLLSSVVVGCTDDEPDAASSRSPSASGQVTAVLHADDAATQVDLERSRGVVRARLAALGVSGVEVTVSGQSLEVRGATLTATQLAIAVRRGRVDLRRVVRSGPPDDTSQPREQQLLEYAQVDCSDVAQRSVGSRYDIDDSNVVACAQDGSAKFVLGVTELHNLGVERARAEPAVGGTTTEVLLELDDETAGRFEELTRRLVGQQVAVLVDGVVQTAPTIANAIEDGSVLISGDFTQEEATELAAVIGAGALPIDLTTSFGTPAATPS